MSLFLFFASQASIVVVVGHSEILVGSLEHEFYDFPYLGKFIIPTDELIFSEGLKPLTRIVGECPQSYYCNFI